MSSTVVTIVGGGLAGTEAAWQLAERGVDVELIEQKPRKRTPAQVVGKEQLAYCGAISPIVASDSIDWDRVCKASRYDKGGDDAYVNCPFDEAQYRAFVAAIIAAEKVAPREFEEARYFEGCLPV